MRKYWPAVLALPFLTVALTAQPPLPPTGVPADHAVTAPQAAAQAPATNPRYGKWRLKPTDPTAKPSTNVMTYEPFGGTGMKVTINQLQEDGTLTPQWGYTTMFDNKETPMTGSRSTETAAVRMISDRAAEITYRRNGVITQQLTNVLSPDGNLIGIIYMRPGADGKPDTVTFATYERMK
jgi:hypothetical protein